MFVLSRSVWLLSIGGGLASAALAGTLTFTTIDDPLATAGTFANGINDSGQIVGSYNDQLFGYLDAGGVFTRIYDPLTIPGNPGSAFGINNAGQIVGYFSDIDSLSFYRGYLDDGGTFTTIDDPLNANSSQAVGINNVGQIVGSYDLQFGNQGYLDIGGAFTTIDYPLALYTNPTGINDSGQIVGTYFQNAFSQYHGFLYSGGTFTTIDDPLATAPGTYITGINNAGQIVGYYYSGPYPQGFEYSNGVFTTIDDPLGTMGTEANGINNAGQIVGTYYATSGLSHGFLATPTALPESSTLTMAFAAFLAMAGIRRRSAGNSRG